MRAVFPAVWRFLPAPLEALLRSSRDETVGTLRPLDFLVRLGTGTGTGREFEGRGRRRETVVEEADKVVKLAFEKSKSASNSGALSRLVVVLESWSK